MTEYYDIPKEVNWDDRWYRPEYDSQPKRFLWFTCSKPPAKQRNYDSRDRLEEMGFVVTEHPSDRRFYACLLPEGWTVKELAGYWTEYRDPLGNRKVHQFDSGRIPNSRHFVNFCEAKK